MVSTKSSDIAILQNKLSRLGTYLDSPDFVYIFEASKSGKKVYKIGHTWNVALRVQKLKRVFNLSNINLLYVIRSEDRGSSLSLEYKLLKIFKPYSLPKSREWFSEIPNIQEVVNEVV